MEILNLPEGVKKSPPPLVSITNNMFFNDSGRASARRSVLAVAQNWPIRSRMVNQSAGKVGRLARGVKCCRKTLDNIMAALNFVSSRLGSAFVWVGLISNNFLNIGNKTRRNANSHWAGDRTWALINHIYVSISQPIGGQDWQQLTNHRPVFRFSFHLYCWVKVNCDLSIQLLLVAKIKTFSINLSPADLGPEGFFEVVSEIES